MTHPTDTAKSEELKACAHCTAPGYLIGDSRKGTFRVKCTGCELQTKPSLYRNEVVAAWNRRSSPPQNDAGVEGLVARVADIIAAKVSGPKMHRSALLKARHREDQIAAARAIIALVRTPMSELQALGQEFDDRELNTRPVVDHEDGIGDTQTQALGQEFEAGEKECPLSPDGKHQVDTSMESGPNNCFHCEQPMPKTGARR